MSYISFLGSSFDVPVKQRGIHNGWKVMSILHDGRKINLSSSNYYYIPYMHSLVSYRGSSAKVLKVTKDKFNLSEKLLPKGQWNFKVDAFLFLEEAKRQLR